jgi:hypothetical protein
LGFFESPKYENSPLILHQGDGMENQVFFNHLGNFISKAWTNNSQCIECDENIIKLEDFKELPHVFLSVFIYKPTPFIEEFFLQISKLNYQKSKLDVLIYFNDKYHTNDVLKFVNEHTTDNCIDKYRSIEIISPSDNMDEIAARQESLDRCVKHDCEFYFSIDSNAHLDDPEVLKSLIGQNRDIIAPIMFHVDEEYANFYTNTIQGGQYSYFLLYQYHFCNLK